MNKIVEYTTRYEIYKNPDLPSAGMVPFKDIFIEWGRDGDRIKIRRLIYPKAFYNERDVERVWQATTNCPFCVEGKTLINPRSEGLLKYVNNRKKQQKTGSTMQKIKNWLKSETGLVYWPEGLAQAMGNLFDLSGSVITSKFGQGLVGLIGTIVVEGTDLIKSPMTKKAAREFFSHFLTKPLDPSPQDLNRLAIELDSLRRGIQFRSPREILSAFARPPEEIKGAFDNFMRALGIEPGKFAFPQFSFGAASTPPRPEGQPITGMSSGGSFGERRVVGLFESNGKKPREDIFGYGTRR